MKNIKDVIRVTFKIVFSRPSSIITAVLTSTIFLLGIIFLANRSFLGYIISSPKHTFGEKVLFFWNSIEYFNTGFTFSLQIITIVISFLVGVNIALSFFYIKQKISFDRSHGISILGVLSGVLGIGCASCGSVLLSSVFGVSITVGIIGFLPLHGLEFEILGVILLMLSIYIVCKKIADPKVCKVKN